MNLNKLFADNYLSNMYEPDNSIEIYPEHLWKKAGKKFSNISSGMR